MKINMRLTIYKILPTLLIHFKSLFEKKFNKLTFVTIRFKFISFLKVIKDKYESKNLNKD